MKIQSIGANLTYNERNKIMIESNKKDSLSYTDYNGRIYIFESNKTPGRFKVYKKQFIQIDSPSIPTFNYIAFIRFNANSNNWYAGAIMKDSFLFNNSKSFDDILKWLMNEIEKIHNIEIYDSSFEIKSIHPFNLFLYYKNNKTEKTKEEEIEGENRLAREDYTL